MERLRDRWKRYPEGAAGQYTVHLSPPPSSQQVWTPHRIDRREHMGRLWREGESVSDYSPHPGLEREVGEWSWIGIEYF